MTRQSDVLNDDKYTPVLDHGFVGLIDHMGDDAALVQAARVSYGKGTKKVSEDRGLIRYLIRHKHTSPIEMAEVKLHVKMPTFVARQWIRHRTANVNEISFRYSDIEDEFYIPTENVIQPQSTNNKQGRAGQISDKNKKGVSWIFETAYTNAMNAYRILRGDKDEKLNQDFYEVYGNFEVYDNDPILNNDFEGVARELARSVVPVGVYTEMYWKIDLKNLLHFLTLRADSHAQYEIRVYADAIYNILLPIFPLTMEAYNDYMRTENTYNLSRMDLNYIREFVQSGLNYTDWAKSLEASIGDNKKIAKHYGMTERELKELSSTLVR